jgi:hypothetical protein
MRKLCALAVFLLMMIVVVDSASACSCISLPLTKTFRSAHAIFIGQVVGTNATRKSDIQNFGADGPILKVAKGFKGISKPYVAVNVGWDEMRTGGMCPLLISFDEGEDYLIFAYGKDLTMHSVCSDSTKVKTGKTWLDEEINADIRRLGSFWFRAKARLWPF